MKARSFFFVCAGIFLLALAFHLGAMTATAQAPGNPVVAAFQNNSGIGTAITGNGDVYIPVDPGTPYGVSGPWHLVGHVFGGPTPASQPSWGQVKAKYRPGAPTQDR